MCKYWRNIIDIVIGVRSRKGNITQLWWRHQIQTFSALLALCAGNSPVTGEFPSQRPVTRSFKVFLLCPWINGWVNNRKAGDLRRRRAHYDITVMVKCVIGAHARVIYQGTVSITHTIQNIEKCQNDCSLWERYSSLYGFDILHGISKSTL